MNAPGIRRLLRTQAAPAPRAVDGTRLREMRRRRGLSLRAASAASGLSASFISALERSTSGASVSALQRLTSAYGGTLLDLLADTRPAARIVRRADRRALTLRDNGIRIEQLARGATQLEPQLFIIAPEAASDGSYAHEGEEFLFVLTGRLTVWIGDAERYRLSEGDALTFPSTLPHRWRSDASGETRLLWINTPPTF